MEYANIVQKPPIVANKIEDKFKILNASKLVFKLFKLTELKIDAMFVPELLKSIYPMSARKPKLAIIPRDANEFSFTKGALAS